MNSLELPNGHTYKISDSALIRLQYCESANLAEDIFEGFASHIPRSDRLAVWTTADQNTTQRKAKR